MTISTDDNASTETRRRLPWWLTVLLVYVGARIVTTGGFLVLAHQQHANRWIAAHPSFLTYATIWDGKWYQRIAANGYPSTLPVDASGHAIQNAWAFLPVYPWLCRALMTVTGLSWPVVSVSVSVLAGAGAALLFYKLVLTITPRPRTALFAALLLCINPVALLFQVAYAESLAVLLLVAALYLVARHRYWALAPVVVVLAFTRPGEVAFALFLGLHVLYRLTQRRRAPFPLREVVAASVSTVAALVSGIAWPFIAGIGTGVPDAYTDTELSWRTGAGNSTHFVPFSGFFESGIYRFGALVGIVAVVIVMAACVAMFFLPVVRRLGVDIRLWSAAYLLYLFAVFFPQSSTERLLLPLFPLIGALALPTSRVWRIAITVIFFGLQMAWLWQGWHVNGSNPTPP